MIFPQKEKSYKLYKVSGIIKPDKLFFYGIALYMFIFFISSLILKTYYIISAKTYLFMLSTSMFFLIGIYLRRFFIKIKPYLTSNVKPLKLYWLSLAFAILGFTLRYYDRFVLRGVEMNFNFIRNRQMLNSLGPSLFGAIGSFFYGFAYIPLFIVLYSQYSGYKLKRSNIVLAYLIFCIPIIDNLIIGSRLPVIIASIIYLTYIIIYGKRQIKKFLAISFSLIFILFISIFIFSKRSGQLGFNMHYSILSSAYAQFVKPRISIINDIELLPKYIQLIIYGVIHLLQYFVHGIFELSYLIDNYRGTFNFGLMTTEPAIKLLKLIGISFDEYNTQALQRTGVYTTFWGPIYIDYGWFSTLIMVIFGFFCEHVYTLVCKYKLYYYTPLYVYISIIIFFMPVINLINSGNGIYVITSYIIFILLCSMLSFNPHL